MIADERIALRAAGRIHEQLLRLHSQLPHLDLPDSSWERCRKLASRISVAEEQGWHLAAERLSAQLKYALADLRVLFEEAVQKSGVFESPCRPLSQQQIYEECLSLQDEFDEVAFDFNAETLSVVTDPVVLEERSFGRFEIRLNWHRLGQSSAYSVIAREPNPASSSADTTHPHVQNDSLCEGDGHRAIRMALIQGRLTDFFLIVDRTLKTYNAGSAYVSLDIWYGCSCTDCGDVMDEEQRDSCENCETDLCDGCTSFCAACGVVFCAECSRVCEGCDCSHCSNCFTACSRCETEYCKECLTDDECECCQSEDEPEKSEESETDEVGSPDIIAEASGSAFQPDRLGEAVVSV